MRTTRTATAAARAMRAAAHVFECHYNLRTKLSNPYVMLRGHWLLSHSSESTDRLQNSGDAIVIRPVSATLSLV